MENKKGNVRNEVHRKMDFSNFQVLINFTGRILVSIDQLCSNKQISNN